MHTRKQTTKFQVMCAVRVGILLLFLTVKTTHAINFRVEPSGDIIIPLHEMLNKTFHCGVDSGEPFWSVFEDPSTSLSTQDEGDRRALNQKGITFSVSGRFTNITIPGIAENNGTTIFCATNIHGINEFGLEAPINLKIFGPPLPPDPKLTFHFPYNLEIHWEVSFSHDVVQGYNLEIISESSIGHAVLEKLMLYNETSYNFTFGNETVVLNCHTLNITVTSVSALGESKRGIVSTLFPTAPQSFRSEVDINVMFLKGRIPIVEIRFEAPFICDFQTSNYIITIEDASTELPVVTRQSNYTGSNRSIVEVFDTGFQKNKSYTVTIDVMDTRFPLDIMSTSKNFSTTFVYSIYTTDPSVQGTTFVNTTDPSVQGTTFVYATDPSVQDSQLRKMSIVAGMFVGIGLIIIVSVINTVILIIVCSKIRMQRV